MEKTSEQDKYEIVKFIDNGFELEVNVSPAENTVWLTQEQMTKLFDVDISRVSRHLNAAIKDGEITKESNLRKTQITGSFKPTVYYDLDAIITVGYRVRSQRGVVFRRWATSVLKQYMLKGYAIDSSRVLVTQENYLNLVNVVNRIDSTQTDLVSRVEKLENKYPELNEKILWNGCIWDAVSCLESLISKAEKRIILIDDYADRQTLDILSKKKTQTKVLIVTDDRNRILTQKEISAFTKQNGHLTIRYSRIFHDRFLLLDDQELYYCGASLKDAGKKVFALGRIHDNEYIRGILERI